jgi:hypothetical protein
MLKHYEVQFRAITGDEIKINVMFVNMMYGDKRISLDQISWLTLASFLNTDEIKVGIIYCQKYYKLIKKREIPICDACVEHDPELTHHSTMGGCCYESRNEYEAIQIHNAKNKMKELFDKYYY